jgi:hypothetical protein
MSVALAAIADSNTTAFAARFDALETKLVTLAIRLAAVTCELLGCIAELDALTDWYRLGFQSCAHYLNYRIGIDLGAAREKVRVAKALEKLPRTRAAMQSGALSYSKARALTRVATAENEAELLGIAECGTASHVEKLVRLYRRSEALALTKAEQQHEDRFVKGYFGDDGMYVLSARLTPEQGALVDKALSAVHQEIYLEQRNAALGSNDDGVILPPSCPQRLADALARIASSTLTSKTDGRSDPAPFEVVVHVDAATLAGNGDTVGVPGVCAIENGAAISAETALRLACDCSVVELQENPQDGSVLDLGRRRRVISKPLRRALLARDGGCKFPGCCATRGLQGHHVRHWSNGGETTIQNIATLCGLHHRAVHEGGFSLRALPDGTFEFRDPNGKLLPMAPPRVCIGDLSDLYISAEVGRVSDLPTWGGEQMDYAMALEGLVS